jgi:hypothetical protein
MTDTPPDWSVDRLVQEGLGELGRWAFGDADDARLQPFHDVIARALQELPEEKRRELGGYGVKIERIRTEQGPVFRVFIDAPVPFTVAEIPTNLLDGYVEDDSDT